MYLPAALSHKINLAYIWYAYILIQGQFSLILNHLPLLMVQCHLPNHFSQFILCRPSLSHMLVTRVDFATNSQSPSSKLYVVLYTNTIYIFWREWVLMKLGVTYWMCGDIHVLPWTTVANPPFQAHALKKETPINGLRFDLDLGHYFKTWSFRWCGVNTDI